MKIKMMTTTNKAAFIYVFTDFFLIIISLYLGNLWLINTQVAFVSSMLIVFASFYSYKNLIEKNIIDEEIPHERELLDELDDRFELYDDEYVENSDMDAKEFTAYYKEQRKKTGAFKTSMSDLFKTKGGAFGVYRLLTYALLVISIMFLIRHELFDGIAFFVGITTVPLSTIILAFVGTKS